LFRRCLRSASPLLTVVIVQLGACTPSYTLVDHTKGLVAEQARARQGADFDDPGCTPYRGEALEKAALTHAEVALFEGALRNAVKHTPLPSDVEHVVVAVENCQEPSASSVGNRVTLSLGTVRDLFAHTSTHEVARTRASFLISHELAHLVARSCVDETAIQVQCEMSADHLAVLSTKDAFSGGLEYLKHLTDSAEQSMVESPSLRHCVSVSELALRGYMMASYLDWVYRLTEMKEQWAWKHLRARSTEFRSAVARYLPICTGLARAGSAMMSAGKRQSIATRLAFIGRGMSLGYKALEPEVISGENIRRDYRGFVQLEGGLGAAFGEPPATVDAAEKSVVVRLGFTPWAAQPDMAAGITGGVGRYGMQRDGEDVPIERAWAGFFFRPPTLQYKRLDAGIQLDLVRTKDATPDEKKFMSWVPAPHLFVGYTFFPELRVTLGAYVRGTSLATHWGGTLGFECSFMPRVAHE